MSKFKKVTKKTGKISLYVIFGLITLLVLILLFLSTQPGKNVVRNQVVNYLENTLKTRVDIGSVDYSLPEWLELNNVYFEDQNKDTLLFGKNLKVDINMLKLLVGNTDIQKVSFDNIFINIKRKENDSTFNYEFLVDAFTGNKKETTLPDTAEMKISLKELLVNKVSMRFNDLYGGTDFFTSIDTLHAMLSKFQPDRTNFAIDKLYADSVRYVMNTYKEPRPDTTIIVVTDSARMEPTYGLYITAKDFDLRNVFVDVRNQTDGMYYGNDVKHLRLANVLFNMNQSIATADTLLLDSSSVAFTQPLRKENVKVKIEVEPPAPWYVKANHLKIGQSILKYEDLNTKKTQGFDYAHLDAKDVNVDITNFLFSKDSTVANVNQLAFKDHSGFRLDSTHINLLMTDTIIQAIGLYIRTPQTLIQDFVELRFDSLAGITKYPQNSLMTGRLRNAIVSFNDLYLLMPSLKTAFPPSEFANNSLRLNTELRGTLQQLYLPSFAISGLNGSSLSGRAILYNLTDANRFSYDIYINQSNIRKSDLFKFIPKENQAGLQDLPALIALQGHIVGDANQLTADVKTNNAAFGYDGRIVLTNISDPAKLNYDLNFRNAYLSRGLIMGYIPPDVQPLINLPDRVGIAGKFKGTSNGFDADMNMSTSYGNAYVKGFMKNFQNPDNTNYDIRFNTAGFNIGRLIRQDSMLGNIAGKIYARGTGFDYKTMRGNISADLASIDLNKYAYKNAIINAQLNNGLIDSKGQINDPNLQLTYDIVANVVKQYPTVTGFVDVDTAMLYPLNITTDTVNFSTYADLQARNTTPRELDVNVSLHELKLRHNLETYVLDSTVNLLATSENGVDDITFKSPFAYVHANGAFDYDQVGQSMLKYINSYYAFLPVTDTAFNSQQINFEGSINEHGIVKALVPGLIDYDSIQFKGSFSSEYGDSALNLKATIPFVQYTTNYVRSGDLDINSRNGFINYNIEFDTLQASTTNLFGTRIHGAAARDSISFNAVTQDDEAQNWFGLAANIYKSEDRYYLHMKDSLLLNYQEWNVSPGNYLSIGGDGILANDFVLSSDSARISIQSTEPYGNSPIDLKISKFDLKSIASLLSKDTLLMSGTVDANLNVSDFFKQLPAFTGNIIVSDFTLMQQLIGKISGSAQKVSENQVSAILNLTENQNDVSGKMDIFLNNPDRNFYADLQIDQLNFAVAQGFSFGAIQRAKGNVRGEVEVQGKFTNPQWNGSLSFDTTKFTLSQLGAPYNIDKQTITLAYPNIRFDAFTVTDTLGSPLVVNGNIRSRDIDSYDLNLDLTTDDFVVMNAKKAIGRELYGFASIDADMSIGGTAEAPEFQGNLQVNDKSDVIVVLPERNYIKDEGLSVVRFIDTDTFNVHQPPLEFVEMTDEGAAFARYLNYNFNVEIGNNASLTIIVDPSTGDEIKVQGDAQLNVGVDPGGNMILAGLYELESGYYNLSYQFLKRKFILDKGSYIMFTGQPMDANVNLTARYVANTNTKSLLGNEISESNTALYNILNQKYPFVVQLSLSGVLSKPTIKFSIQLPEGTADVNSELRSSIDAKLAQINNDEAAVNKQVFSLLLFGRFIGEQSSDFFKGSGGTFDDIARQSVSQFLSAALNEIAADMIAGVDIDLNLNSYRDYEGSGSYQRTDLNVALSKTFLDDRLTVKIGQNFGLEGQDVQSKVNSTGSTFSPDISATYKLTKDGKYMLRAYRKNQYEAIVDGYVMESGMSFILTMDYERFNELFRKKPKTMEELEKK